MFPADQYETLRSLYGEVQNNCLTTPEKLNIEYWFRFDCGGSRTLLVFFRGRQEPVSRLGIVAQTSCYKNRQMFAFDSGNFRKKRCSLKTRGEICCGMPNLTS